jgi:acyl carrier protein
MRILMDDIARQVKGAIAEVLSSRSALPPGGAAALSDDALLLGGDFEMDSLDLATMIVNLQDATGKDPFADEFVEFRTIGELVELFRNA